VSQPGTLAWFAAHEFRLAWRDWLSMMTAGHRRHGRTVVIGLVCFVLFLHLLALSMVSRFADTSADPDKLTLVMITASAFLSWALMLSQTLESTTRAFYARSDLDLLLSSPISTRKLFSVRIAAIAASVVLMSLLLAAPFINVLVVRGGAHWLAAYGVVSAMGAVAAALAVAVTIGLFRTIGAKRTRLIAQIAAAVVGAAFVIGLQIAAITSNGTMSRFAVLASDPIIALAPEPGSILWWPARAILGDITALSALLAASFVLLLATILLLAGRFADCATQAADVTGGPSAPQTTQASFRSMSPRLALRRKEWALLRRDPWLMSQTLMQLLYLVPPAVMLWRSFGGHNGGEVLLVPILVMAAGQLSGGLAWLAISGEDAPDLVATAPVRANQIIRAKIEAVLGVVAILFGPFVLALACLAPLEAAVAAAGIALASLSSIAIQLWFRVQAKRSHFRRRQTSSRVATFAEAFSSIAWAATAAVAATGSAIAVIPGAVAFLILAGVRKLAPMDP
jgi:ABC-2 type transport system permease protein